MENMSVKEIIIAIVCGLISSFVFSTILGFMNLTGLFYTYAGLIGGFCFGAAIRIFCSYSKENDEE